MPEGNVFRVRGRDGLLFRDGRPFSAAAGANVARTLDAPLPATLAGLVRTLVGDAEQGAWSAERAARMREIESLGPILCHEKEGVLFPRPADALRVKGASGEGAWTKLRPDAAWAKLCKMPDGMLPLKAAPAVDGKPEQRPYWTLAQMSAWLSSGALPPSDEQGVLGPEREERVHVAIDSATKRAKDGMLFAAEYLDVTGWSYLVRTGKDVPVGPTAFGGERRMALIERETSEDAWPTCPSEVCKALKGQKIVRMALATPALFSGGWRPGWTSPPSAPGVKLSLIAAGVERKVAVTGWDLEKRQAKAARWAAPAGSVYFFRVDEGDPSLLADAYLSPVSDDKQDRRDGFGLALWGIGDC